MTTSKLKVLNKVLSVLLCLAMLLSYLPLSSLTAIAATTTGSCGTNANYTLDDSGVLTISGTGAIKASAFANKTTITSVVIEPGITSIGEKAFYFCTKMTSVKIPSTVESIGNQAFYSCKIKALYIPSSVKTIGYMAFYNCGNSGMYVTIEANSGLTIGHNAFHTTTYGAKLYVNYLGTTAPTLGDNAFSSRVTVNLPATYNNGTVTTFANATVKMVTQADAVASVTFPNNMVIYYDSLRSAFQGASGTTSTKITLLKDIEAMSTSSILYGTADVIFDMNGKNITINGSDYIAAHTGAKLTMTGTGKITYNYNATRVPNGAGNALYAPVQVYTGQNDVGVAELVIGGSVTVEATDDLTAAVSVGANEETAPAKLTVKDNAKLISNNASYIVSYNSPASKNRWGKCEIILEGGTFENKAGGYVVGYDDTQYDNPDELYHTYIAIDGIKLDSKLKNVYYKLTNAVPATLTYTANAVTHGANTYGLAGSTVAFTAAAQSGYTIKKILANDTETTLTEGVYSFTMPSKLVTLTSEGEGTPLYDVTVSTATGGTVLPDKTSAAKDDTVTLTVTAADGYKLDTLTVDGTNVTDSVADGKYTFTMPGKNIIVAATFKIDHTHAWEYAVSGNVITAYCNASKNPCEYSGTEKAVSLTLTANGGTYTGNAYKANIVNNISDVTGASAGAISYYKVDAEGATTGGTAVSEAKNVGYYYAVVTLGEKTAVKAFTISKASGAKVSVTQSGLVYNGEEQEPGITVKDSAGKTIPAEDYTVDYSNNKNATTETSKASVTVTFKDSSNYTGTATATFDIAQKPVTVSGITAKDKTYDGTTDSTLDCSNAVITDKIDGDSVNVTATGTFSDKNAKNGKTVTISNITLDNSNYTLAESGQQTETTANITPKKITATITPGGGTYGGTITPATAKLNGVLEGDEVSIMLLYEGTANDGTSHMSKNPPTKAGNYIVTVNMMYHQNYIWEKVATATFTVNKADQDAPTVTGKDETISGKGDGAITAVNSTMEYRKDGESTYTAISGDKLENLAAGKYYVRVKGDSNHNPSPDTEVTVAAGRKLAVTVPQNQIGYTLTVDKNALDWQGQVTVTFALADGYSKSNTDFAVKVNGTAITLDENDKYIVTGAQTDITITVAGVVDETAPEAEISITTNKWTEFLNDITFGLFFKETQDITFTATDKGSGVDKIYYYISEDVLTEAEVKALSADKWTEYDADNKPSIDPDKKCVVYAKATDKAQNVKYISSTGLVFDSTAPTLFGIENGGIYYGDKIFKALDDNFLKIEVDGVDITATTQGDDEYKIVADNAEHTVTVTDKAGNVTEYTVTVYKEYSVTFTTEDESGSYEKEFKYGEVITIPTNMIFEDTFRKSGYTLTGWQGYTEGMTMPLDNLTFTAIYTPNRYTVEFDSNGGAAIEPITVIFGEKYGSLPSSSITGLSGGDKNWYLADENGNATDTNIKKLTKVSIARNHTLVVKRSVLAPNVRIALTVPGGISDGYQYYIPGASQRVLTATVGNMNTDILNYTYQWYKDNNAISGATSSVLTLDGNVSDSGTYKVEVTATLKDGTNIVVTANSSTGSKEQKVKILHAANTLSYDANGGEGGPQSNYTGGTSLNVSKATPTREHYDFIGWNTMPDGNGSKYEAEDVYTFADDGGNGGCVVTLYAQWQLKKYTVTYMADGEPISTEKVEHGKNATLPTVPKKDGYVGKWDSDGKNIVGDTTISAVYTLVSIVKPDEVKPEDKADLEDAKAKLEEELKDDLYTEDEKKAIEDELKRIDDALTVIGNVEAVEELIDKLPESIKRDDEAAIKAANDAYNALSDYEKSLVDKDTKKALDDAVAALAELGRPADTTSPNTRDNSNLWLWIALLFVSGSTVLGITLCNKKRKI